MSDLSEIKIRLGVLEKDLKKSIERSEDKSDKAAEKQEKLADKLNDIHISVALIGQSIEGLENIKEGLGKGGVMTYGGGAAGTVYLIFEAIKHAIS